MAVPGPWSITLPANRGTTGLRPLVQWTAASGAVTYNIVIVEETAPGSGTFGLPGRTIAWSLIAGTSLQLPDAPTTDPQGSGGDNRRHASGNRPLGLQLIHDRRRRALAV
jgi:hypothetical protein